MKHVSVIIPVYNTGKLMYRCFDSLVNQTVGIDNIEVIVVDDGSTDDGYSLGIINEYVAKYPDSFKLLTKKNGGQGSARNMAFPYATGEYITCLDSDDSVENDWVEKMYGKAVATGADFVGCGYKAVKYEALEDNSETDKVVVTSTGKEIPAEKEVVLRALDMRPVCKNKREMFIDASVCMFTTLFKRSVLEKSEARYPEGVIYEDMAFFIELLPWIEKPVYIEEALSIRTLHEGSTMTNVKPQKVANVFPVFDAIINFYKEKGLYDEYKNEVEYFMGKVLLCSSLNRVGFVKKSGDRRMLVKKTFEYLKINLPDFKSNPYIHGGARGQYLKHYNKLSMNLMTEALRIRFIIKHDYNT